MTSKAFAGPVATGALELVAPPVGVPLDFEPPPPQAASNAQMHTAITATEMGRPTVLTFALADIPPKARRHGVRGQPALAPEHRDTLT
jgi:hypothetical protein